MKHIVKHVHFVGMGGVGMSGIAEVLLNLAYCVSGSDVGSSLVMQRLAQKGAKVMHEHAAKNIEGADVVVVSSAVRSDNPEVLAARNQRIPIISRATMLAELMRLKQGIAVAGTHGKTTTTSLIASVLAAGGLDPTFVIGGRLISAGANARLGSGDFIVAEADESDASFLNLMPVIEVITNIDGDHMETYGHDFAKLKQAFIEFTGRLPFYGKAVVCIDDHHVRQITPLISKPIVRYGLSPDAQIRAVDVQAHHSKMHFTVMREKRDPLSIVLNMPGIHNVQNALAAIAIATDLGLSDEAIQRALAEFNGVGRRFQLHGEVNLSKGGAYTLVDDYGHHPSEMAATISAARGVFPDKRLVLVFQPHRYTRTRDCFDDFVKVLSTVDALILTEVYAAGEPAIMTVNGDAIARAIRLNSKIDPVVVQKVEDVQQVLDDLVCADDVVITMGAGSIGILPNLLMNMN